MVFKCHACKRCRSLPMYEGRRSAEGWKSYNADTSSAGAGDAHIRPRSTAAAPAQRIPTPKPASAAAVGNSIARQMWLMYFLWVSDMVHGWGYW